MRTRLSAFYLFHGMEEAELTACSAAFTERLLSPGTHLFKEGEPCQSLFLIESGSVKLTSKRRGLSELSVVVGAGGVLGESAILSSKPHLSDALAAETSRVLVLDAQGTAPVFKEHPGLHIKLLRAVGQSFYEKVRNLPDDLNAVQTLRVRHQ